MLRTGSDYLKTLREDGRQVYIGGELVEDVTSHPAFRNAAQSVAALYDMMADPARADEFTYVEPETGRRSHITYMRPKSREDLAAKRRLHQAVSEATYGLIGRSPDHVAGFVTGMACRPEVFEEGRYRENILNYWRYIRDNEIYVTYAVVPPSGVKRPDAVVSTVQKSDLSDKARHGALRVVSEDESGVTLWGSKILATGAVLADEVLIGNLYPLRPGEEQYSITCAVPVGHPGVKILARKPYENHVVTETDDPMGVRFDESDAIIFFDNVHIPWERVFVHNDIQRAAPIFYETPAHMLGNFQAQIRFLVKVRTMLGLIRKVSQQVGTDKIPPVRERLNRLAMTVALAEGLLQGMEANPHVWDTDYVTPDLQALYGMIAWSTEQYPPFALEIRDLMGGHPFQQPAHGGAFDNEEARNMYMSVWGQTDVEEARNFSRLIKSTWDFVGSEFASRHLQYEMFYAGPKHITRDRVGHFFRWDVLEEMAERVVTDVTEFETRHVTV